MATVPLSGTNIALYSGIPFNSDYKHTRWFDSLSDQLNWFAGQTHVATFTQYNFQRAEGTGAFMRVNMSVDELWNVNYISFQNADYSKVFYGFVTQIEYVQNKTTKIHFEIDVMQTWRFEMDFKPSFVAREHCPLWNADGSPVINTVDEGLHYGAEYNIVSAENYRAYSDLYFLVIVSKKTVDPTNEYYSTVNGLPQPLVHYIHPFKLDGSVPNCNMTLTPLVGAVMNAMFLSNDAVNNVVSMYVTDMLPDNPSYDGTTITFNTDYYEPVTVGTVSTIKVKSVPYSTWIKDMGNKYSNFTSVTESKLLMYPYTVTIIDDLKGNRTELKNEYINSPDLILDIRGSLGTSNKTAYSVKEYLTAGITDDGIKEKLSINHALIDTNANDLPVMADMLSAYIQGNRNSLQNQKDSIYFNNGASMASGITSMLSSAFAGATAGMTSGALLGPEGIGAGAVIGGAAGAIQGGISATRGGGNMMLQIQALQAKQQDISNVPPALYKLGGNTYFDFGNGYTGVWIIKKEITQEYRDKLTAYFNMFGYKLNTVKIPNFHTRQSWNYIQTVGCVIRASINNEDLEELKQVFDKGITLWHVDDIGNYTLSNDVIA